MAVLAIEVCAVNKKPEHIPPPQKNAFAFTGLYYDLTLFAGMQIITAI